MNDAASEELLRLNQRLLDAIAEADWATYKELCDPSMTAFEPEALGQLVEGMDFHRFYFDLGGVKGANRTAMIGPHVRVMGESAVVSYVRLNQRLNPERLPVTTGFQETRVWQRQSGRWKHVHFHRTPLPGT
jgi:calcium/calmodulin-dependent protein kinase (CaM kinase) II